VREDINDVAVLNQTLIGSTVVISTGISVGYIVWIARGGLLLASLLSSMPAWRLIDPLPILARFNDEAEDLDEGDSLATIVEQSEAASMDETTNNTTLRADNHNKEMFDDSNEMHN